MQWKEVHDNEEKCKEQAYTRVAILRLEGEKNYTKNKKQKTFHNTDQNSN